GFNLDHTRRGYFAARSATEHFRTAIAWLEWIAAYFVLFALAISAVQFFWGFVASGIWKGITTVALSVWNFVADKGFTSFHIDVAPPLPSLPSGSTVALWLFFVIPLVVLA